MADPVILCDGQTFERVEIQDWLNRGMTRSPITNLELEHLRLVPNIALKSAIERYKIKK